MGVHGLWKLLQPTGKPVPVETLENKVLAVDVSIWLHQTARGFQDARGQALPNAHLLGLFHRLCKLLFWRVKPVFVFDGGAPLLKQHTVAARRRRQAEAAERAEAARRKLLGLRLQRRALQEAIAARVGDAAPLPPAPAPQPPALAPLPPAGPDQMFALPELPPKQPGTRSDDEGSSSGEGEEWSGSCAADGSRAHGRPLDLHSVDVHSAEFRALPANVRHDILSELKETRKQSSWGRLHEMPRESGAFSSYQMQRLLKRRSVQESLEAAEKEMGGRTLSLAEMEELMRDTGALNSAVAVAPGQRIAADTCTRYILLSDNNTFTTPTTSGAKADIPDGEEEIKSPESDCKNSNVVMKVISSSEILVSDDDSSNVAYGEGPDFHVDENSELDEFSVKLQAAQNFMFENSGLTQEQILAVIKSQNTEQSRPKLTPLEPSTSKAAFTSTITSFEEIHATQEGHRANLSDKPCVSKVSEGSAVKISVENRKRQNTELSESVVIKKRRALNKELAVPTDSVILREDNSWYKNKDEVPASIKKNLLSRNSFVETSENFIDGFDEKSAPQDTPVVSPIASDDGCSWKTENGDQVCSLSSDDDLIEVEESLKPTVQPSVKSSEAPLQVVIQSSLSDLGEDIFGDIFEDTAKQQLKENSLCKSPLDAETEHEERTKKSMKLTVQQEKPSKAQGQQKDITEDKPAVTPATKNQKLSLQKNSELLEQIKEVDEIEGTGSSEEARQKEYAPPLSLNELQDLEDNLNVQRINVQQQQAREERLAATINDQMIQEAQELLQLFGIPYIIAPMEAEAQCAFLDQACLTDGTITDDSDVWLFGGQKVYKNFFDQKKHVLQFRDIDIQRCFKLTRAQLVLLALLVGSDYTTGLPGVGPVTALEILAAFPTHLKTGPPDQLLQGLRTFKDWCSSGMPTIKGHAKLRAKLKDVQLSRDFPSVAVVDAYMSPKVDECMEKFTWAVPDVESIKEFTRIKFGWSGEKTQEILQPILKKLNIKITQLSIDSYFQAKPRLPPSEGSLSKRVQRAVKILDSDTRSSSEEEIIPSKRTKSEFANSFRERLKKKGKDKVSAGCNRGKGGASEATVNPENPSSSSAVYTANSLATEAKSSTYGAGMSNVSGEKFILQREKDKLNLLKNKLKAIEVFRKSKLDRTQRYQKTKTKVLKEANLSESSSSNDD